MDIKKEKKKEIRKAAVLKYTPEKDGAPKLVAGGKGRIAEKIIETAKKSSIPVYKEPELAGALIELNVGDEIPPELYEAVAEILAFVYNIDRAYGERTVKK